MKQVFDTLRTRMLELFKRIADEKETITIDGVPGYSGKAQFTNGKVICEAAYVVSELLDPDTQAHGITQLTEIIHFTSRMLFETWGILYALEGIYRLDQHGLAATAIAKEDLSHLKQVLDWRTFVDTDHDYALIHKPTNYYGVAFGIARYRELLGWEPVGYSEILLDHLLQHISRYSGEYGFMDETIGGGRFDRYSILIPAEITELVVATKWQEPDLIRRMLSCSAHICLRMANPQGTGFSYGRSIGAYGDAAALQILSTAAAVGGILTEEETLLAQGYCCALVRSLVHFWYDEDMQSINMWDKGRRTDAYRNKNRILGENLSLSMQIIGAKEQWERCGRSLEETPDGWQALLVHQSGCFLTRFADDPLPRSLIIVRDGNTIWSLPVISGAAEYIDRDPYLPVPRSNFYLEAVPDCTHGAWLPVLMLNSGTLLIPTGFADRTELQEGSGSTCQVRIHQTGFVKAGVRPIETEARAEIDTVFTFAPGIITREDTIRIAPDLVADIDCLRLQCDILAGQVEASGYEHCEHLAPEVVCLDTPHGRCREAVRHTLRSFPSDGVIHVRWTYHY